MPFRLSRGARYDCSSMTSCGKRSPAETRIAAQRQGGALVGARGAAEPEVDASGVQRFERAELFGDYQRRMVRQHDAAGADADRLRAGRDVRR